MQPILIPCLSSMTFIYSADSCKDLGVPASNHAQPRFNLKAFNLLVAIYLLITEVISNSPLGEGLIDLA